MFCHCSIQSGNYFPPDPLGTIWGCCHLLYLFLVEHMSSLGGGGTGSVVWGWTCSVLGGGGQLHWSHSLALQLCSSLLLHWSWWSCLQSWLVLFQIPWPWGVICDVGLVLPELWIIQLWVLKLVLMITGGCTLSPSTIYWGPGKVFLVWVGLQWTPLQYPFQDYVSGV